MAELVIRPFEAADREAVVALWAIVFPDEPAWNESHGLIDRKLTVQPELFLLAELDGRIVGSIIAGFDGVRGWVHKVGAHPSYRRKGIAGQLMSAVEEGLRAMGCNKLNLQVREGNETAVRFYEDAGYQPEPRVSMSKHL